VDVNMAVECFVSARDKTDNKKLFGFSFARLMEAGGATLRDGIHELYIYKCEDRLRLESSSYLQLPSSARDSSIHISSTSSSAGAFSRSSKESVYIHTLLCSTKLTQNGKLFVHEFAGTLFTETFQK
jgi:dedicator of cytokinesis protein 3